MFTNEKSQCTTQIFYTTLNTDKGFPGSSAGKESTCNARDPSSIPGSGRSSGEGVGYPLQYSWTSLMAQLVKSPPAMWELRCISRVWLFEMPWISACWAPLPWDSPGKNTGLGCHFLLQCGRPGFNPCVGKIPWRRELAFHSSILAWRIPWTIYSPWSHRVRQDWATVTFN